MPRYIYQCYDCDHKFKAIHSIKNKLRDCPFCGVVDSLARIPSKITTIRDGVEEPEAKVGDIVKKSIEEARQELRQEKQSLNIEEYEA